MIFRFSGGEYARDAASGAQVYYTPWRAKWILRYKNNYFQLGTEDTIRAWEAKKNREALTIDIGHYTQGVL